MVLRGLHFRTVSVWSLVHQVDYSPCSNKQSSFTKSICQSSKASVKAIQKSVRKLYLGIIRTDPSARSLLEELSDVLNSYEDDNQCPPHLGEVFQAKCIHQGRGMIR